MIKSIQLALLQKLPGLPAQLKMAPPIRGRMPNIPTNVRHSAVCILLYEKGNEWHTLLMKRTEDGAAHSGQISFPGGKFDKEDLNLNYTALRECEEEIGISKNEVKILGNLTPLYIPPSNFIVTPVLCSIDSLPNLTLSENEVAEVYHFSLEELFSAQSKKEFVVNRSDDPAKQMRTPSYQPQGKVIWGATAMMLSELQEIYSQVK